MILRRIAFIFSQSGLFSIIKLVCDEKQNKKSSCIKLTAGEVKFDSDEMYDIFCNIFIWF
jgi:hypothetical protein